MEVLVDIAIPVVVIMMVIVVRLERAWNISGGFRVIRCHGRRRKSVGADGICAVRSGFFSDPGAVDAGGDGKLLPEPGTT